jgi:hypothetical protein
MEIKVESQHSDLHRFLSEFILTLELIKTNVCLKTTAFRLYLYRFYHCGNVEVFLSLMPQLSFHI